MGEDRRAMYEGFRSDGRHSLEWVRIANAFLKHAFAGNTVVVKCPCTKCQNLRFMGNKNDMLVHLWKHGFMPNYLVWREHGEKEQIIKSDRNKDGEKVDEMLSGTVRKIEVNSKKRPPPEEVQKFYKLRATSNDKVHEGTDVTIHQAVTRLMTMKSKYKFSNQCYDDIIKLVTDLVPSKHKKPKDTANDVVGHDRLQRQPSCSSAESSRSVEDAAMEEHTRNAESESMRDAALEERVRNAEKRARMAEGHALQAYECSKSMCMWMQQFSQNVQSQFNMPAFQPPFTQYDPPPMYPPIYPLPPQSGQAPPPPPRVEAPQVSHHQACWPMYPPQSWQAQHPAYWPMFNSWLATPPPLSAPQKDTGGQSKKIKETKLQ